MLCSEKLAAPYRVSKEQSEKRFNAFYKDSMNTFAGMDSRGNKAHVLTGSFALPFMAVLNGC